MLAVHLLSRKQLERLDCRRTNSEEAVASPDPARALSLCSVAPWPRHSRPSLAEKLLILERALPGQLWDAAGHRVGRPRVPRPAPRARATGSCLFTGKRNLPSEITKNWEGQEGFVGPSPCRWVGRGGDKGPGALGPEITRDLMPLGSGGGGEWC